MKHKLLIIVLSLILSTAIFSQQGTIQSSFYHGDNFSLFNNLTAYISSNPDDYLSYLYFRDVLSMDYIRPVEWYVTFSQSYLNKLKKLNTQESLNIHLQVNLIFQDFLYNHKITDTYNYVTNGNYISQWKIHDDYIMYGPYDFYQPDIYAHTASTPFRIVKKTDSTGKLYLNSYIFNNTGTVRADTSIFTPGPVKLRINSNTEYKLYINNSLVLENTFAAQKSDLRVIQTNNGGICNISLIVKNSEEAYFSILTTDTLDTPVQIQHVWEASVSDIDTNEVFDFSFSRKVGSSPQKLFHRAWALSLNNDKNSFFFYNNSLKKEYNPVTDFHFAQDLIHMPVNSNWQKTDGWKRMQYIRDNYPDFVPVRYYTAYQYMKAGFYFRALEELSIIKNKSFYQGDILKLLLYNVSNRDALFLRQVSLHKKNYPEDSYIYLILAKYYQSKDNLLYQKNIKKYLSLINSEQESYSLMNHYLESGDLTSAYDCASEFLENDRYTFSTAYVKYLIYSGKHESASKRLLSYSVINNSPYIQYLLGLNQFKQNLSPDLYWSRIDPGEIHSTFPKDYLTYANSTADDDENSQKVDTIITDFLNDSNLEFAVPYKKHTYIIYKNNTALFRSEELIYINTDKDIQKYGEFKFPFSNPNIIKAAIYKRDGSYTDSIQFQNVRGNVYLTLQSLSKDSLLHIKYDSPIHSALSDSSTFLTNQVFITTYDQSTEVFELQIEHPDSIPVNIHTNTEKPVRSRSFGNRTTQTLTLNNIPDIRREYDNGSAELNLPYYQISSFTDEENTYLKWFHGHTLDIPFTIQKSTEPENSYQLIQETFNEIQEMQSDRFISMIPQKPDDTAYFKRGSETDKVFLCRQKLAEKGIESYPCIVKNPYTDDNAAVGPGSFYGIVLYVPQTKKDLFLDFSSRYNSIGTLSPEYSGEQGIVINSPYNTIKLQPLQLSSEKLEITVDCTVSIPAYKLELEYTGFAASIRRFFQDERYLDNYVSQILGGFQKNLLYSDISYSSPTDMNNDFIFKSEGTIPSYATNTGSLLLLQPFLRDSSVKSYITERVRKQNLYITSTINTKDEYTVLLPENYNNTHINISKTFSFNNSFAKYTVLKKKDSNVLIASEIIFIEKETVSPEKYPEFRKFVFDIYTMESKVITIKEDS